MCRRDTKTESIKFPDLACRGWVGEGHECCSDDQEQGTFDDATGEELDIEAVNKARQEETSWLQQEGDSANKKDIYRDSLSNPDR